MPAAALRPLVPEGLMLEETNGAAWLGVVPFSMSGVMLRGLPDLPGLSAFREVNVRLYVHRDGKPGVWFLSLDATNPIAVWVARRFLHLPYFRARISLRDREQSDRGEIEYLSERPTQPTARFAARYRPVGDIYHAAPGTLDHLLTERYCLYARSPRGTLSRIDIHHAPWPLQPATGDVDATALLASHGLSATGPPLLHFAHHLQVRFWPPHHLE
jgi:uncharacterized protein